MYIEMKHSDIAKLKRKLWEANDKKCPVLNREVPLEKMALDHAHKRKDEDYAPDKGVIREALDFRVNAVLGKLENSLVRAGLSDVDLPDFLRRAADYFERGAYLDEAGNYYVHPKEVKRSPSISKRQYNKLKKAYAGTKKFPEFPKSGKLTKGLEELFGEYDISPWV